MTIHGSRASATRASRMRASLPTPTTPITKGGYRSAFLRPPGTQPATSSTERTSRLSTSSVNFALLRL